MKKKNSNLTPIDKSFPDIGSIMGSSTGETEQMLVSGGWAGTDDATSTSLSDQLGNPPMPEEEKPLATIRQDFETTLLQAEEEQQEAMEEIADEQILHASELSKKVREQPHTHSHR